MSKLKKVFSCACLISMPAMLPAQALAQDTTARPDASGWFQGPYFSSPFSGPYVGVKAGFNVAGTTGRVQTPSRTTFFPGITAGLGVDLGSIMLGGELFADFHHRSSSYKDGGFDAKLGVPLEQFMPYLRLGVTGQWPESRMHWGLGGEYKVSGRVGIAGEWTADKAHWRGKTIHNDSFTIGVHYYFK